jgi:hypothetical protein
MRGHIVNMARNNLWRLSKTGYDLDDMIQEALICYYKCRNKYVGARPKRKANGKYRRYLPPKNPDGVAIRHFMRLVQRSFRNHIYSLAEKTAGGREIPMSQLLRPEQLEENGWDQLMPPDSEVATAASLLASAPDEIARLFALLVQDAVDGYRRFGKRNRLRETNNQYFCRLLGVPEYDIEAAVHRHFFA